MGARGKVMPWRDTTAGVEQERFILEWVKGGNTFSGLCRAFGISRKTGYKRVRRYQMWGLDGLGDLSRAPHSHPKKTGPEVEEKVIALRMANPTWGPKKLVAWLKEREAETGWPAPSTVGNLLERHNLTKPRRKVRRTPAWGQPLSGAHLPNQLWCADFKGHFRTCDGQRVDPLTVADANSRYLLACQSVQRTGSQEVRRVLERVFREYGLPQAIRTDNGPPFASVGLGGLTQLLVWWTKLGVIPERIEPGHPEQNGRLERLHRTLKAETAKPPRHTRRNQQQAFDDFRTKYNQKRPHEALGQEPARHYQPSIRCYPSKVRSPEYGDDVTVRRVRSNGEIKWQGAKLYLSEALRGEPVGLMPREERYYTVCFGPLLIGLLHTYARTVSHTPIQVLPMSLV